MKLLPCPRCGSRAEVVCASHIRCVNTYNCDCETRLGPAAWNRRTPYVKSEDGSYAIALHADGTMTDLNAEMEKDAERYRKIKNLYSPFAVWHPGYRGNLILVPELDAWIDAWEDDESVPISLSPVSNHAQRSEK